MTPNTARNTTDQERGGPPELEALAADLRLVVARLARRLRQLAEEEVSASSLSAMASIERLGPVTLGDLASVERVQPPTITRMVDGLEEAGLVSRRLDASDRRVTRVRLTAQGRRLLDQVRTRKTAYLARALRDVAPEDREVLARATQILDAMLGDRT